LAHIAYYLGSKKANEAEKQNNLSREKKQLLVQINEVLPLSMVRNAHDQFTVEQLHKQIAEKEARLAVVNADMEHPWVAPSQGLVNEAIALQEEVSSLTLTRITSEQDWKRYEQLERPKAAAAAKAEYDAVMLQIPVVLWRLRELCITGNITDWDGCPIERTFTGWDAEYGTEWRKALGVAKPKGMARMLSAVTK
jgi:hypothetical protein